MAELVTNGTFTGNADGWDIQLANYNDNHIEFPIGDYESSVDEFFITQLLDVTNGNVCQVSLDASVPDGGTDIHIDIGMVGDLDDPTSYQPAVSKYTVNSNGGILTTYVFYLLVNGAPDYNPPAFKIQARGVNDVDVIIVDNISVTLSDLSLQTTHLSGACTDTVQTLNVGKDDDSTPIYYELETQELEFGNRIMNKRISDKLVVFSENADDSKIQLIADENDAKTVNIELGKAESEATLPVIDAHFLTARWSGNSTKKSPVLEGFYFNKVEDKGIL